MRGGAEKSAILKIIKPTSLRMLQIQDFGSGLKRFLESLSGRLTLKSKATKICAID